MLQWEPCLMWRVLSWIHGYSIICCFISSLQGQVWSKLRRQKTRCQMGGWAAEKLKRSEGKRGINSSLLPWKFHWKWSADRHLISAISESGALVLMVCSKRCVTSLSSWNPRHRDFISLSRNISSLYCKIPCIRKVFRPFQFFTVCHVSDSSWNGFNSFFSPQSTHNTPQWWSKNSFLECFVNLLYKNKPLKYPIYISIQTLCYGTCKY